MTQEGDVAIVAIDTEPSRASFSFVVLTTYTIGEAIGFTDRGWRAAGGFRSGESETIWIFPRTTGRGVVLTLGGLALDRRADQVFAFGGMIRPDGTVTDRLVYGLNLGGPWQADATSDTTSALPSSLVGYQVALPPAVACAYTGPTMGTKSEMLALIDDPARWTCSDGTPPAPPTSFTVVSALGESCASDFECRSGFCVGGVCCDSECRRTEAFHCSTCFYGADDPRNGTCGPAPTTYLCRLSRGDCDPVEHCDGVSTECPPDRLAPPGTVCRTARGLCDRARPATASIRRAQTTSSSRWARSVAQAEGSATPRSAVLERRPAPPMPS